MQKIRTYEGTLTDYDSYTSRIISWGSTYTPTSIWDAKSDFINETIAAFLRECGITSAAYEMRSGDSNKWLYIYDAPFFPYIQRNGTTNYNVLIALPRSGNNTEIINAATAPFVSTTSGDYKFGLVFSGSNKYGFVLRFCTRDNPSIISYPYYLMVLPCINVTNSRRAVAYSCYTYYSSLYKTVNSAIDIVNGRPDQTYCNGISIGSYNCVLRSTENMKKAAGGKFPLVPIFFGTYKLDGLYHYMNGFDIPDATSFTTLNMAEFSIGSREFISLTTKSIASSYSYGGTTGNYRSGILETAS